MNWFLIVALGLQYGALFGFYILLKRVRGQRYAPPNLWLIPTATFREEEGDEVEDCIICLENFETGAELRLLPCQHRFHRTCTDRWLLAAAKLDSAADRPAKSCCPVCKRPAIPVGV